MSENRAIHIIPKGIILKIAILAMLAIEALFISQLVKVDVLPGRYLAVIIIALALIDFGILLLTSARKRTQLVYLGLISALILCCVLVLGSYYLYSTNYTLDKISKIGTVYETYDVVTAENGSYDDVKDLRKETVYIVNTDSKSYQEAQGKLKVKTSVEYETKGSLSDIGNLFADESQADNLVFLSDASYDILCEEDKTFKKNTKVIYKIKVESKASDSTSDIDVTEDSFNIYVSGMDVWGDINRVARSDVNMIITVNPKTRQILLTSIPRDTYVALHQNGEMDKLTHTGVYGIDETLLTVEDWLGVHSDFYVRANFTMVRDLINAIGGIRVYSDYEFSSHLKDYHYVKGWNDMSGRAALYFARERKAFKNNDEQRVINQQRVVKAIIRKATRSEVILTNYTDILQAINKYMQTDLSREDMSALVKMQIDDMDKKWTIKTQSVKGDLTMKGTYTMGMGRDLLVSIPREKSVEKVKIGIDKTYHPEN
ncbi:MAG: LCP family protein, partial [Bacillota bacterium]